MKIGNSVESASVPTAATTSTGRTADADTSVKPVSKLAPANATATATATAPASMQVELSSTAATLRAGTVQAASADFDVEKVNRVSESIADGTFTVNPEAIADKLIANAQELLSKGQR